MAATKQRQRTPLSERIRDANTDLRAATELRTRLTAFQTQQHLNDTDDEYLERIRTGTDDLTRLRDDYIVAKTAQTASVQFRNLIAAELSRIDTRAAERRFAHTALDMCRVELDDIMARVEEHRTLIEQHPDTVEAALRHGTIKDYETVESILGDYDALRAEYRRQVQLIDSDLGARAIDSIQCRNFLDIDPGWRLSRSTTAIMSSYPDAELLGWFRNLPPQRDSFTRTQWLLTLADNEPCLLDPDQITTITREADQLCRRPWNSARVGSDRAAFHQHHTNIAEALER